MQTEEDLFAAVGYGSLTTASVIHKLAAVQPQPGGLVVGGKSAVDEGKLGIVAGGVDDMAIHLSQCCTPVPGDEIVGYVTRGRGLTLHRKGCPNLASYLEKEPSRLVEVQWTHGNTERFNTGLRIVSLEQGRTAQ